MNPSSSYKSLVGAVEERRETITYKIRGFSKWILLQILGRLDFDVLDRDELERDLLLVQDCRDLTRVGRIRESDKFDRHCARG